VLLICFALIALTAAAATKKSGEKKASPSAPDKAYMQKIWDGWSTLDPLDWGFRKAGWEMAHRA